MSAPRPTIDLSPRLRRRMLLLTLPVVWVVAASAPLAYLVLGVREVRARAANVGARVARVLRQEVQVIPALWRYDTLKLSEHLRSITSQSEVLAVEVADRQGRPIGLADRQRLTRLDALDTLWGSAAVTANNRRFGTVWVAVSTERVIGNALLMLAGFAVVGAALAALLYGIPMRAVGRAEQEIRALVAQLEQSGRSLEQLNVDLEDQVQRRSAQLEQTLAELRDRERRLRELSSRAISLQEVERRTIARNLHDSAGQALTALRIKLQLLQGQADGEGGAGELVQGAIALTDEATEEIRRAVMSLGPRVVDELGFVGALQRHLEDYAEHTGLAVERRIELRGAELPRELENACYHIVQEALNNVAKHAGARSVSLSAAVGDGAVTLEIADDGAGFDAGALVEGASTGLTGMRERAELIGGAMTLRTSPGEGTRLAFVLPLERAADDAPGAQRQRRTVDDA